MGHFVRMKIENSHLESVNCEAHIVYCSEKTFITNEGKYKYAARIKENVDYEGCRIFEEYFNDMDSAVEWLHKKAEETVMHYLNLKVRIGNMAQKEIEIVNKQGFQL